MKTRIFCGKGGVGKTISATSLALFLSRRGEKTLLIDCDGGHSVTKTLGIADNLHTNVVHTIEPNFYIVIIENPAYKNVMQAKSEGLKLDQYFCQFPGHFGIVAFADMLHEFFGVPIDIPALQKFTALVIIIAALKSGEFSNIILDVEPTAGLERLLSHADAMVRTLRNLKKKGMIFLATIALRWPDIADYISGEYMEDIDHYAKDIMSVVKTIKNAEYMLVCTPEFGPVTQMFEIRKIIQKFGGKVRGYVINNVRDEAHEEQNIALLKTLRMPNVIVPRRNEIHTQHNPTSILLEIGENLYTNLRLGVAAKSQEKPES